MKGTQMENQARLGAALLGGYVLGRTKKGGFALRLATRMFLSGSQTDPKQLARDNVMRLLDSDIVEQLRGQITEAARAAADARVQSFADNLTQRTEALKAGPQAAGDAAEKGTDTVKGVTDQVTGTGKDQKEEEPDEEPDEQDADAESGSGPDAEADEADQAEEGEEDEGDESSDEPDDDEGEEDEGEVDDDYSEEEKQERIKELKRKRIGTLRNIAVDLGFDADEMGDLDDKTEVIEFILEAEEEDRQKGKGKD